MTTMTKTLSMTATMNEMSQKWSEIKNTHDKIVAISAVDPGHCSVAAGSAYKVHSQGY